VTVSALQAEAAVAPVAGSVYTLAAANSGRCVDVVASSAANGGLLQQWGCHPEQANQQFAVNQVSAGVFTLVSVNTGKCVDVPTGAVAGTQLQQWNCGDATKTGQQFTFSASGTGTYSIASVRYGLCLSVQDSAANGAPLVVDACATSTTQQWGFTLVSSGGGGATCPCTVAKDGTGTYATVQAAINAAPANATSRHTITIKAGTYREHVVIPADKPFIHLQGAGATASGVVIVYNTPASSGGTDGSTTVLVHSSNFSASNLTISNDYDEVANGSSQALALLLNADRNILNNVRLLGDQDTFLNNTNARTYVVNSYIEGTVDFIYGGGILVCNACQIYEKRTTGGPITAANTDIAKTYGMLFYKSTVTGATNNTTTLGRPWRQNAQVTFRECSLSATIATAQPWINMGDAVWQNARFFEYKNAGAGATVNGNRPQLTDAQAANYTPQKYLAGSDGWNPL
jgi:pectinesterase